MSIETTRRAVQWPDEGYSAVPYELYSDRATFDEEQEKIFRGPVWHFVGLDIEVPKPGDYKTSYVGITPVVFIRDEDGSINVLVNRCAHRGNLVCYKAQGNAKEFTCVYHNWVYDRKGQFVAAAFGKGVGGKGGLPADFQPGEHNLQRLRAEVFCGMVFCTFNTEMPGLQAWLGETMLGNIRRVLGRPMKILGAYSQSMPGNWKLYMENVRDTYHPSLLHFMMATFNYNRHTATGGILFSDDALHHCSWSADATDKDSSTYSKNLRAVRTGFQLKDPSVIDYWQEYPCGTTAAIQSLFPTCVVQQIRNVIGCRLILPKTVDSCELLWWILGCEDDTPEQEAIRVRQSNLVGPAGLVSMEDGVVVGWVQRATRADPDKTSFLQMGGRDIAPTPNSRVTEVSVRSFWRGYRQLMGQ